MNHKVQVFINGCLTLKLSLSWNTVICSLSEGFDALDVSVALLSPFGETGIVDRSTWPAEFCSPLAGAASVAVAMVGI